MLKKTVSIILTFAIVFTLLPLTTFALENPNGEVDPGAEQQQSSEAEELITPPKDAPDGSDGEEETLDQEALPDTLEQESALEEEDSTPPDEENSLEEDPITLEETGEEEEEEVLANDNLVAFFGGSSGLDSHHAYTYIVSVHTGKVLRVDNTDSNKPVKADLAIPSDIDTLYNTALFEIYEHDITPEVKLFNSIRWDKALTAADILNAQTATKNPAGWECFEVVDNGDGTVALYNQTKQQYLSVYDQEDNILRPNKSQVEGDEEKFYVVEGLGQPAENIPSEPIPPTGDIVIVHKATNQLLTVSGVAGDPIMVNTPVPSDPSEIPANAMYELLHTKYLETWRVNFKASGVMWVGNANDIRQHGGGIGGWESVTAVPLGNGEIALKENQTGKYISVDNNQLKPTSSTVVTDNETFIFYTQDSAPEKVENLAFSAVEHDRMDISWDAVTKGLISGYEVWYAPVTMPVGQEDGDPALVGTIGTYTLAESTVDTALTVENLALDTHYAFQLHSVISAESVHTESDVLFGKTLSGPRPSTPEVIGTKWIGSTLEVEWEASAAAESYDIYRAESLFAPYTKINTAPVTETNYVDSAANGDKYKNYYRIVAVNTEGESNQSEATSLEITLFGKNMVILSETDDMTEIYNEVERIYQIQKDEQFGEERYSIYFRPGDYTAITQNFMVGFYTQMSGLGETPLETRINNIVIPAYLPGNNATCNFWRSSENLTIAANNPGSKFTWAVSQAAPLRRMNVERESQFDWNHGWASGGYVADSIFLRDAGSYAQQQYYMRNSKIGSWHGVNWNAFFQGVEGAPLSGQHDENGFATNWNLGQGNNNYTNIATTPIIREKPFLYLDSAGEYKVFVPALKEDSAGVSWEAGNIGNGSSLDLIDDFYIAHPEVDNAASINAAIAQGKHIFLTPGIYYAEDPIQIDREGTIVLGTGMATIIPTNQEAAVKIGDVGGVIFAGVILDAGTYSEAMIVVGTEGDNTDFSDNPTLLIDLFVRVGGTTDQLTRADYGVIVHSNNVIGDHFWIWRADHGAGVAWDGNTSKVGVLVNGDDVIMYGLFNEHFQEYETLWNGERGRTYFYQNEIPYDPQSQEDWMSHDGTVNGYAAYKVANSVNEHYAVGLGIYDVLINTNGASVFLDNAVEVPHKPGVIIKNVCIVELGDDSGPLVGINSIVNGTGTGISTGIGGRGFSREYLLKFVDGVATGPNGTEYGVEPADDIADGPVDKALLQQAVEEAALLLKENYTAPSWDDFYTVFLTAKAVLEDVNATQNQVNKTLENLKEKFVALEAILSYGQLDAEIAKAERILAEKDLYVPASIRGLNTALESAKRERNAATTQAAVDQAANQLATANALATFKGDIQTLQRVIAIVGTMDFSKYTPQSVATLLRIIGEAQQHTVETPQEVIDNTMRALLNAFNMLTLERSSGTTQRSAETYTRTDTAPATPVKQALAKTVQALTVGAAESKKLVEKAKSEGLTFVKSSGQGQATVAKEALALLKGFTYQHDTLAENKTTVEARLTLPISETLANDIMVSASTTDALAQQVKAIFGKYFSNSIEVVNLHHKGEFGAVTRVAIKPEGLDTENNDLHFYSYDEVANKYSLLEDCKPMIDNNGYLHFNTSVGGVIIISNGALEK